MNILAVSTWFPYPPDNGSKQRAYHLLRALSCSHEVTSLAFSSTAGTVTAAAAALQPLQSGARVVAVAEDPFRYVHLPQLAKFLSPIPLACWPSRKMRSAVASAARQKRYDAVVAIQAPAGQYALQIKAVVRILDLDVSLGYQPSSERHVGGAPSVRARRWASWLKASRYQQRLLRSFDLGTVALRDEAEFLQAQFGPAGCRFAHLDNGVDCASNRPGLAEPSPNALVYNGALTYSANYDAMRWFLAEVYPIVKANNPGASLTITGSTQGVDLDGLAIDDSVRLTGYLEDVRLPVAQAGVCVVPIRHGGGTRLKILEAMALGTPVVSTSKGAVGLDVIDGEHLLVADDPAAFATRTTALLRDAPLRARLAENARRLVEARYDWGPIGKRFVGLVEEAVMDRAGRPL